MTIFHLVIYVIVASVYGIRLFWLIYVTKCKFTSELIVWSTFRVNGGKRHVGATISYVKNHAFEVPISPR